MAKVMFVSVATVVPDGSHDDTFCIVALDSHGQLWQRWWNDQDCWSEWERLDNPEEILDVL